MFNNLKEAREWLLKRVEEKTKYTDFVIQGEYQKSDIAYSFKVNYNWQLNAWKKNVSREICVIWLEDRKTFTTADLILGGI